MLLFTSLKAPFVGKTVKSVTVHREEGGGGGGGGGEGGEGGGDELWETGMGGEDGIYQSWQHFLKGAVKDLAQNLGCTLGRENHHPQSPHAPCNNYLLKNKGGKVTG